MFDRFVDMLQDFLDLDSDSKETKEEKEQAFQDLKDDLDALDITASKLDEICESLDGMFLDLDNESDFQMNEVTNFAYDLMFSTDDEERKLGDQLDQVIKSINNLIDTKNDSMIEKPQLTLDYEYTPAKRDNDSEGEETLSEEDKAELQQVEHVSNKGVINGLNVDELQKSVSGDRSEVKVGGWYDDSLEFENTLRKFDNILDNNETFDKEKYGLKIANARSFNGVTLKIQTLHDCRMVLANYLQYAIVSEYLLSNNMVIVQFIKGCRLNNNSRILVRRNDPKDKELVTQIINNEFGIDQTNLHSTCNKVINHLYLIVPDNQMRGTAGALFSEIHINKLQLVGIDFQYLARIDRILDNSDINTIDLSGCTFDCFEFGQFKIKADSLGIQLLNLDKVKVTGSLT